MNLCVCASCARQRCRRTSALPLASAFPFSPVPINRLIVFKTFLLNAKYSQCAVSRDADD